jgi:fructokinase
VSLLYGGVETGGTWTVCALGTGPNNLLALASFATTTPDETVDRIGRFFDDADEAPVAIGVGAFGPLDLHPGSRGYGSVLITPKQGWSHTPLRAALEQRLGVPVAIETDVGAAAFGEHRWGAGRDADSLAYVTVGTGIGAGLIIHGEPWHGLIHPEVGHIPMRHDRDDDQFAGVCPLHGDCWEGLASGPAIAARWGADPEELADLHPAWELEAHYLALGCLTIVSIASPHLIILGGGVMARPRLLELTRRKLVTANCDYLEHPLLHDGIGEYLVGPALGDRAGVLGAIALAHSCG